MTAAATDRPPLLVLDALQRFCDERGLGHGPLRATRLGLGSSNHTFLLERGDLRLVLRRPPRPPYPASAHNILREAALQEAVRPHGVRAPRVLATCDDPAVLGAPFSISELVPGPVMTDTLPPLLAADHDARRELVLDVVAALAELHAVDVAAPEVQPFVRPGSYAERQVRRFRALWEENATRDIPQLLELGEWLAATAPEPAAPAVVHGDYRIGNLVLEADRPRVAAIVDWEMGAVGDPRADLGYLVATYSHRGGAGSPLELTPATAAPGFPEPAELVEQYVRLTGREVQPLAWFRALALWKGAIFCEAIYARHLRGEMQHDRFAPTLQTGVPELARAAVQAAQEL
jgi:aminoglycoside phosphotransferase (APT) family kinase protein